MTNHVQKAFDELSSTPLYTALNKNQKNALSKMLSWINNNASTVPPTLLQAIHINDPSLAQFIATWLTYSHQQWTHNTPATLIETLKSTACGRLNTLLAACFTQHSPDSLVFNALILNLTLTLTITHRALEEAIQYPAKDKQLLYKKVQDLIQLSQRGGLVEFTLSPKDQAFMSDQISFCAFYRTVLKNNIKTLATIQAKFTQASTAQRLKQLSMIQSELIDCIDKQYMSSVAVQLDVLSTDIPLDFEPLWQNVFSYAINEFSVSTLNVTSPVFAHLGLQGFAQYLTLCKTPNPQIIDEYKQNYKKLILTKVTDADSLGFENSMRSIYYEILLFSVIIYKLEQSSPDHALEVGLRNERIERIQLWLAVFNQRPEAVRLADENKSYWLAFYHMAKQHHAIKAIAQQRTQDPQASLKLTLACLDKLKAQTLTIAQDECDIQKTLQTWLSSEIELDRTIFSNLSQNNFSQHYNISHEAVENACYAKMAQLFNQNNPQQALEERKKLEALNEAFNTLKISVQSQLDDVIKAEATLSNQPIQNQADLAAIEQAFRVQLEAQKEALTEQIKALNTAHQEKIASLKAEHAHTIANLNETHKSELESLKLSQGQALLALKEKHNSALQNIATHNHKTIDALKQAYKNDMHKRNQQYQENIGKITEKQAQRVQQLRVKFQSLLALNLDKYNNALQKLSGDYAAVNAHIQREQLALAQAAQHHYYTAIEDKAALVNQARNQLTAIQTPTARIEAFKQAEAQLSMTLPSVCFNTTLWEHVGDIVLDEDVMFMFDSLPFEGQDCYIRGGYVLQKLLGHTPSESNPLDVDFICNFPKSELPKSFARVLKPSRPATAFADFGKIQNRFDFCFQPESASEHLPQEWFDLISNAIVVNREGKIFITHPDHKAHWIFKNGKIVAPKQVEFTECAQKRLLAVDPVLMFRAIAHGIRYQLPLSKTTQSYIHHYKHNALSMPLGQLSSILAKMVSLPEETRIKLFDAYCQHGLFEKFEPMIGSHLARSFWLAQVRALKDLELKIDPTQMGKYLLAALVTPLVFEVQSNNMQNPDRLSLDILKRRLETIFSSTDPDFNSTLNAINAFLLNKNLHLLQQYQDMIQSSPSASLAAPLVPTPGFLLTPQFQTQQNTQSTIIPLPSAKPKQILQRGASRKPGGYNWTS